MIYSMILPHLALSVRQPWAWAIIHGGKDIENRTFGSIRAGNMQPGHICIHAASGLTVAEYRYGLWRLGKHGVQCPAPADLPRSAIIGTVEVTDIVSQSESEWFGGKAGLVLKDPKPIAPIPSKGALGYFAWTAQGTLAKPLAWMSKYGALDPETNDLFPDADRSLKDEPPKPWPPSKKET